MKSVLLTNLYLSSRTGSELHILELSKAFVEQGWDVTCFTLATAYPLRPLLRGRGVKIVEFGQENELANHYDVLFAQHHLVSDYVIENLGIHFDKIVVSMLGPTNPHEQMPLFSSRSSLFVCVSDEVLDAHEQEIGKLGRQIPAMIFPNYYLDFDRSLACRIHPLEKPERIAVVSNHVPDEVQEALTLATEYGIEFDAYGYEPGRISVAITPELLSSYDAVITIGRTVQTCLALGIPVYCYDFFGGPGYLTESNFEDARWSNFSGRSNPEKRTGRQIVSELIEGYGRARVHAEHFRKVAESDFSFTKLFDQLLEEIDSAPFATSEPYIACSQATLANNQLLCAIQAHNLKANYGKAQLFYSEDGTCSEEQSVVFDYCYNTAIEYTYDAGENKQLKPARFDPDVRPCICRVANRKSLKPLNAEVSTGGADYFYTADPMYEVCAQGEDVPSYIFRFAASPIDRDEALNRIEGSRRDALSRMNELEIKLQTTQAYEREAQSKLSNLENRLKAAEDTLASLRESRIVRLIERHSSAKNA